MSTARQKILIVDDRPQNLFSLRKTLEGLDVEVVEAQSGNAALRATLSHTFALAILDVQMPEMDGYELAELLRGDDKTQRLPIIFLTAFSGDESAALRGFEAGAVDYIVKPFNANLLVSKVRVFLELDRYRTELERSRDELKSAKEKAEAANRAKSIFLANMSHEIRTPLNAVLGYVQLLSRDETLSTQQRVYLDVVERSGDHLLGLLNDLLEMSRIEAGRLALTPIPFDFHRLLTDLELMFHNRTQEKGLALVMEPPESASHFLLADAGKIRQVLINLIGNAVKFTDEGQVLIRSRSEPAGDGVLRVSVEIHDTGCGISPEDLGRLFRPFEQALDGLNRGGAGLGLAISQRFAKMMGGTIIASSRLGQGSTFCFQFRAKCADPLAVVPQVPKGKVKCIKNSSYAPRILAVDDQESGRDLVETLLEQVGFDVCLAPNGVEALAIYQNWKPHLVVTDKLMPVMDGVELARRIRASSVGASTPIIMLSGSASEGEAREILSNYVNAFLSKPLNVPMLYAEVARLLGLEYEYEPLPKASRSVKPSEKPVPTLPSSTNSLCEQIPADLKVRLEKALAAGVLAPILECLDELEVLRPELGARLRDLGEQCDFTEIAKMLAEGRLPDN